jgi:hypothetical protein
MFKTRPAATGKMGNHELNNTDKKNIISSSAMKKTPEKNSARDEACGFFCFVDAMHVLTDVHRIIQYLYAED